MLPMPTTPTILFIVLTIITVGYFYWATNKNNKVLLAILAIMTAQAVLSMNGFFLPDPQSLPIALPIVIPSIILIIYALVTPQGKAFINSIDLEKYTYLHTIRIPVEIGLFLLAQHALIPNDMTFEGKNFDIISGITAPLVANFGLRSKKLPSLVILVWNVICLFLVLFVVGTAVISIPSIIQQINFDQPNVAIAYFPFVWLPGIIVPAVIFGHIITFIRRNEL